MGRPPKRREALSEQLALPEEAKVRLREAGLHVDRWPLILVAADLTRRAKPLAASNRNAVIEGVTTAESLLDNLIGGFGFLKPLERRADVIHRYMQKVASRQCLACDRGLKVYDYGTGRPHRCKACVVSPTEAWAQAGREMPEVREQYAATLRRFGLLATAVILTVRHDDRLANANKGAA